MAQKFIGVVLPIRLGQTGMFDQSTTVIQQVRSNFKNLILTKKGERVGQPELGCDLWKILFEPLTEEALENARLAVADAVDRWLPFIELTDFQIAKTDDENIISIKCLYRFRNNPNVKDQITVAAQQFGAPTVGFTEVAEDATPTKQELTALENARRIRRAEMVRPN
jgi:phage baseplate assembly protein W